MLKPSDRIDLYIASLMVGCSREAILASQAASVLLKKIHVPTFTLFIEH